MEKRQRVAAEGAEARAALAQVQQAQERLEQVNDRVAAQILALQAAANAERAPLYASRGEAIGRVPHFWQNALLGHPWLGGLLTERDRGILSHLEELTVEENEDIRSGYSIRLRFTANPYFHDAVVEKRLCYGEGGELSMHTTPLEWKEGQRPELSDGDGAMGRGGAANGGGERGETGEKKPPGPKRSFSQAMEDEAVRLPLFFLTFLADELPDDDECDGMVETLQMCDAIKDEVWAEPMKYLLD
ncbi:hypothetical protein AB1Y20_017088 [Prymnesium parvum]|uniref:Nucleosome assembly protein n=1 Tax=Prymnesium parvum TaxID=97485 RepID=A0AB34IAG3_PRYPA